MKILSYLFVLMVAINMSWYGDKKPIAPTTVKYDETRYTHEVTYSGDYMILKLKHRTSLADVRVYVYPLDIISGFEVVRK